jgi:hypothetical protein
MAFTQIIQRRISVKGKLLIAASLLLTSSAMSNVWAGWYLMTPPTQKDLDDSCSSDPGFFTLVKRELSRETDVDRMHRCAREGLYSVADAPLYEWVQTGTFETLAECNTERTLPDTEAGKALAGRMANMAADSGITKDELMNSYHTGINLSRCLASDDPRLAK